MKENLIYHDYKNSPASYGRDGGTGRDILITTEIGSQNDYDFLSNIRSRETSVAALLEPRILPTMESALKKLTPVWNTFDHGNAVSFSMGLLPELSEKFIERAMRDQKRHKRNLEKIDMDAMKVIQDDIALSVDLASVAFDPDKPVFLMVMNYAPGSKPVAGAHEWHNDFMRAAGKIVLQRSLCVDGLRFKFKEQAQDDELRGVAFSTGRVLFKVTQDNMHSGCPISPNQSRVMYTMTGFPRHDIQFS